MATIECVSSQPGVPSVFVEVTNITDMEVLAARRTLDVLLNSADQISTAVADAFIALVEAAPRANPSDLWQHVIYRHLMQIGWSDSKWKRVSGFALERAFVKIYAPRLAPFNIRMQIRSSKEANELLNQVGIMDTRSTKIDLFLEGNERGLWYVFGAAHVKSSIAERIQDDVPASLAFMSRSLVSIAITMDSKSYPPPHGIGINYGELGGRSVGIERERLKRNYIEVDGQFDGLFSYNLRTPPSPPVTVSGKRIYTMSFFDDPPDHLVTFLVDSWQKYLERL